LEFGFSTVATLSLVNSQSCENCKKNGFQYWDSLTIRKLVDHKMTFKLEKSTAEGQIVEDNLRLRADSESVIKQFPFLLVNKWSPSDVQEVDGVIGLSRSYVSTDGQGSGSAFLEALYQSGQIEQKLFAVHFDTKGGSQIEFGGYNSSMIDSDKPITFVATPYARQWTMKINAFKVTDKPRFANGAKNSFFFD